MISDIAFLASSRDKSVPDAVLPRIAGQSIGAECISGANHTVDTINSETMLYFAYSAMLNPELLSSIAPGAKFLHVAHLPEAKLTFPTPDGKPSVRPATGNTVWGAIFEMNAKEAAMLERAEEAEGRHPRRDLRAVDRAGNKYEVVTYCHAEVEGDHTPDPKYMEQVVRGARHWSLPAGWVAGLEDLGEDALI